MGLAFSVPLKCKIPRSLANIYKEIKNCYPNYKIPQNGCLDKWSKQGVLLLNTVLTVAEKKPDSHSKFGWQILTDEIINFINIHCKKVVFILWGKKAEQYVEKIDIQRHLILIAPHPSPFSARKGFIGCKHFLLANEYLIKNNIEPIKW
ncbi:uracil-DNA glycosylase [Edhazardia aedis USNM 41457]|uniref:Uracil-DNA glycosylase n=1 Tax=Edhazardia aedis (strain USNM 41457) TaxID=1003232 RepID=J8ZYX1_EDHAE|nr:uracil-DNA glycosylase [Edhazardia aedis USNM 41457]|eukprot:EJW04878.1 uracil-DNA glycosylase [Edhazardia aedis USNM 41457]